MEKVITRYELGWIGFKSPHYQPTQLHCNTFNTALYNNTKLLKVLSSLVLWEDYVYFSFTMIIILMLCRINLS